MGCVKVIVDDLITVMHLGGLASPLLETRSLLEISLQQDTMTKTEELNERERVS